MRAFLVLAGTSQEVLFEGRVRHPIEKVSTRPTQIHAYILCPTETCSSALDIKHTTVYFFSSPFMNWTKRRLRLLLNTLHAWTGREERERREREKEKEKNSEDRLKRKLHIQEEKKIIYMLTE